jgi:response regulator RpfG family c-di-GMP phosphodiesterase
MWSVLIFSDSRERAASLGDVIGALDHRICSKHTMDLERLAQLASCRDSFLALVSSDNTPLALRAVGTLRREHPDISIITEVAADHPLESLQALAVGATEYLKRPVAPWEWQQRVRLLVELHRKQHALTATLKQHCRLAARRTAHTGPMLTEALGRADMLHDEITGNHDRRTGRIAGVIAAGLDLPEPQCRQITFGASLHDIGKIGIPDQVLHKPSRYDDDDRKVMRAHPRIGYEILKSGGTEVLQLGAEIALTHHERYDGSGYPDGLAGNAIPLAGRITAVADVFDAITDGRTYRQGITPEEGYAYLRQYRGTLFDPDCVDALGSRLADAAQAKIEY